MKKLLASVCLALLAAHASGATLEEDVQRYVDVFNGPVEKHSDAADTLAWMGLSDPRLFDIIERRVLEEYVDARKKAQAGQRGDRQRIARCIRGLGFSGNPKYVPTLEKLRHDNEFDRFARNALEDLPQYEKWNPIISNRATFEPGLSDDANRVRNMVRGDDLILKRVAAKRVYFAERDPVVIDRLAEALKKNYGQDGNADVINTLGWLIKGVAAPKDPNYVPLLREVARYAANKSVQRHANEAAVDVMKAARSR